MLPSKQVQEFWKRCKQITLMSIDSYAENNWHQRPGPSYMERFTICYRLNLKMVSRMGQY